VLLVLLVLLAVLVLLLVLVIVLVLICFPHVFFYSGLALLLTLLVFDCDLLVGDMLGFGCF
jgi:hypothetical protein